MTPSSRLPSLHVLIVDDSPEDRLAFTRLLGGAEDRHYTYSEAETVEEGLDAFLDLRPDCVLLDYRLPDADGLHFLEALKERGMEPPYPIVMMTGAGDERVAVEAIRAGAANYLVKSKFTTSGLNHVIGQAVERVQTQREVAALRRAVLEQSEQEIEEAEQRWKRLTAVLPQAVLIVQDALVRQANDGAAVLLGYPDRNALVGTTWELSLPFADRKRVREAWRDGALGGATTPVRLEHRIRGGDGEVRAVRHIAIPVTYFARPAQQVVLEAVLHAAPLLEEPRVPESASDPPRSLDVPASLDAPASLDPPPAITA